MDDGNYQFNMASLPDDIVKSIEYAQDSLGDINEFVHREAKNLDGGIKAIKLALAKVIKDQASLQQLALLLTDVTQMEVRIDGLVNDVIQSVQELNRHLMDLREPLILEKVKLSP